MKVHFSVLSYYPSFTINDVEEESIHVGILFHNEDTDERLLEITTKWKRVEGFDDELDIEFFKLLLFSLRDEIKNTFWSTKKDFDIHLYTKKFINELRFSKIITVDTDDFNKFVKDTKKVFLRYDFNREDRPDKNQQLKYIRDLFKSTNIQFDRPNKKGTFNEVIRYDYVVGNCGFKIFTFLNKDIRKLVSSAKAWALTAKEMNDEFNIKTIFVYDTDIKNDNFKIIYNILNKYSYDVMKIDEAINYIKENEERCKNAPFEKINFFEK